MLQTWTKFDLYKVSLKCIKYLSQYDRNVCEPKNYYVDKEK